MGVVLAMNNGMQDLIATTLLSMQAAGGTQSNSSGLIANVIWMLLIAFILVVLLAIGFMALGTRSGSRRKTDV